MRVQRPQAGRDISRLAARDPVMGSVLGPAEVKRAGEGPGVIEAAARRTAWRLVEIVREPDTGAPRSTSMPRAGAPRRWRVTRVLRGLRRPDRLPPSAGP